MKPDVDAIDPRPDSGRANGGDLLTQAMFRSVVSGTPYHRMAHCHGICRSAVQQRVMRLARQLQLFVGVDGVPDLEPPSLQLVREHRAAYLEALASYAPDRLRNRQAIVQSVAIVDMEKMLVSISGGRHVARDRALLMLLFELGLKPCEIARLEVRDFLLADGSIAPTSSMRAAAAHNSRPRTLYFTAPLVHDAIDAYLGTRQQLKDGGAYRGFDPEDPLIARQDGRAFGSNANMQHPIHYQIRALLRRAGCIGYNVGWARIRLARRLREHGLSCQQIAEVLGVHLASIRALLSDSKATTKASANVAEAMASLP